MGSPRVWVMTALVCSFTMGSPRVWVMTALVPTVRDPWLASLTWVFRAGAPKMAGTSWTAPFSSPLSPATAQVNDANGQGSLAGVVNLGVQGGGTKDGGNLMDGSLQ